MVTVYKTVSALYDVIHFCAIYFNREEWIISFKPYAAWDHNILEYYNEFTGKNPLLYPPEYLYPFFYFTDESITVMKAYCQKYLIQRDYTLPQIIENFQNIHFIKKFMINIILEPYQQEVDIKGVIEENPKNIEAALAKLNIKKRYKKYYKSLFEDFDNMMRSLICYVENAVPEMAMYHESKSQLIPKILKKFNTDENLNIIRKIYNLDDDFNFDAQPYVFCFINRYLTSSVFYNSFSGFTFCLGCDFSPYTCQDIDYGHVNYISVMNLFKDSCVNLILDYLLEGEATITELVETLHISKSKVIRAIKHLHNELAVIVEYSYGKGIYYIINPDYWYHVKNIIENRFNKILNNIQNISILYINDINFNNLIKLLSNFDVNEIIDGIAEGADTLLILAQKLYIPIDRIKQTTQSLVEESALLIGERDRKGVHYQINPAYWISVKSIFDVKINKILNILK